jgi:gamma-glutamylcyclotransferase (GGCT)/AIG2-like uncharacterized protein YtfP
MAFEEIQLELFKRLVPTITDSIKNYKREYIRLFTISEGTLYPILEYTANPEDKIEGHVLKISHDELLITDSYEGESYPRKKVTLESGISAWCYVAH